MTEPVEDLASWLTAVWDEEAEDAEGIHELGCDLARPTPFPCTCAYPASVLARIAADRKILALHSGEQDWPCQVGNYVEEPCETRLLLASRYQDRPGFRPEWLVERQGVEE